VKTVASVSRRAGVFCSAPGLDVLWVPGGDPTALSEIMSDPDSNISPI
jgi:hypothetical protein